MSDDSEHNHIWQRRILDRPSDIDYTQNKVGDEVVIETAKLVECPSCHRPAVAAGIMDKDGVTGIMFTHRRQAATGQPTEVCVPQPKGSPTLVMLDAEGNTVYQGTTPPLSQLH